MVAAVCVPLCQCRGIGVPVSQLSAPSPAANQQPEEQQQFYEYWDVPNTMRWVLVIFFMCNVHTSLLY